MKIFSPPHPAIDLSADLNCQLVYTLTDLLPPPFDDTQEALRTGAHAAIAKVAALLPVNANETDLKRKAIDGAATEDARALHLTGRSVLRMPNGWVVTWPDAARGDVPAAYVDLRIASWEETNSQGVAFETCLSA